MATPEYGELARRLRIRGNVIVAAIIDKQGTVCDAQIVRGLVPEHPEAIDEPVRLAILRSNFEPPTYKGKPVAQVYYLTVRVENRRDARPFLRVGN